MGHIVSLHGRIRGLHAGLMSVKFGKGIEVWFIQMLILVTTDTLMALVGVLVYLAM